MPDGNGVAGQPHDALQKQSLFVRIPARKGDDVAAVDRMPPDHKSTDVNLIRERVDEDVISRLDVRLHRVAFDLGEAQKTQRDEGYQQQQLGA